MRKYTAYYTIITLLSLLVFSAEANCFAGANDIKARMQERLPTIVGMKSEGIIGENSKGYLAFVPGAAQKNPDVVSAENMDRETVYTAIAKQQGTTALLVGERRAIQIGEHASSGEWLQKASGEWYRK